MSKIKIPIFPLNGVIFFPNTDLPLNIFEDRYIKMINFSLSTNKLIGMIQTKDNGRFYDVGCVGKINSYNETKDGSFIINLIGQKYFSILKEIKTENPFKLIEAKINEKENIETFAPKDFDKKLFIQKYQAYINQINKNFDLQLIDKIQSEILIKLVAMSCNFSTIDKQMLLETYNLNEIGNKLMILFDYYSSGTKNKNTIN